MYRPSLDEAKEIAADYNMIPVSREIYSDIRTPIEVLKILKSVSSHCFLLESLEGSETWGRYTFLGFDPKLEVTCLNGTINIKSATKAVSHAAKHPREYIQQILDDHKSPQFDYLPPFTGGLVGYFSYDYIKYNEPSLKLDAYDQEGFKDVDLMLFDKVIAFDHLKQKIILIANVRTEGLASNYSKAVKEIESMVDLIKHGVYRETQPGKVTSEFRPLFKENEYCEMVNKGKHYIHEGDIFQVVLSNRFEANYEGSLLNTYRVLRTLNPSPYMFYISSNDLEIAGASPETLVKLQNATLYTFPLAGTKPRGKTAEEDVQNEKDLLSDPKELAEHNMLVDLGRNDLGRISKFGTVKVEKYLSIERFSHVMHIGSTVKGEIREDKKALDAVDAVLPAGTLSGAPKIRACEIINELENNKRGIYGGAIGYIDFTGNLDTCIAIRIVYKKNGKIFVRSGAGIVADSVPEKEYQECINKAQAVMKALKLSEEVID
ncbi:anthranilate synthase component I [Desulfosporosinus acidiphilus SJ4]|uniref:Anthranilate synthase component 1 n=1 Tax=Desulfosporosinus acidiphilus (strain DSM 22704 / JCM 16185 / SJ4) TaxID=646529 RepID=I4D279_DESAJ|nr:anthranilate synthase component I [Desulfosporosinus acidiphilus]AFM39903.1 anthranilate synthase component I [Desulfosporosinus acidiphilus SJ4]